LSRFSRVQREFLLCPNCLGLSSSVRSFASLHEAGLRPKTRPGILLDPGIDRSLCNRIVKVLGLPPPGGLRKRKSQHTRPLREVSSSCGAVGWNP